MMFFYNELEFNQDREAVYICDGKHNEYREKDKSIKIKYRILTNRFQPISLRKTLVYYSRVNSLMITLEWTVAHG